MQHVYKSERRAMTLADKSETAQQTAAVAIRDEINREKT